MLSNSTYRLYTTTHHHILQKGDEDCDWRVILAADVLLLMLGLEIGARPWLYPRAVFAYFDVKARLKGFGAHRKQAIAKLEDILSQAIVEPLPERFSSGPKQFIHGVNC